MANKTSRLWTNEESTSPLLRQLYDLVVKHAERWKLREPVLEEWLLFFTKVAFMPPERVKASKEIQAFKKAFDERFPNAEEIRALFSDADFCWDLKWSPAVAERATRWADGLYKEYMQTKMPISLWKAFQSMPGEWLDLIGENANHLLLPTPPAFNQPIQTYSRCADLLETYINQTLVGQQVAVRALSQAVWESWLQPPRPGKAHKLITIAGGHGSGKTTTVQKLAEFLQLPMRTIQLAGFSHHDSLGDLCGHNGVYNNSKPGALTQWVNQNPRSLIVFDGPEYAAETVQSAIAEMVSAGEFYDKFNQRRVDLSETIVIIITSEASQRAREGSLRSEEFLKAINKSERLNKGLAHVMAANSVISFAALLETDQLQIAMDHLVRLFRTDYAGEKITADPCQLAMLTLCELGGVCSPASLKDGISAVFHRAARFASSMPNAAEIVIEFENAPRDVRFYLHHHDPVETARILRGRYEAVSYSLKTGEQPGHVVIGDFALVHSSLVGELGEPRITPSASFDDVIGQTEAKKALLDLLAQLKHGAKGGLSLLMHGEPGTGKTLLARAAAAESNLSFLSVAATELDNERVGSGPAAIRSLFERAKRCAPCILFIDELDAIGRDRKQVVPGSSGHSQSLTLNELLKELDGFSAIDQPLLVIGATNLYDVLDPALLQRFKRHVHFQSPTLEDRMAFLRKAIADCGREVSEQDIRHAASGCVSLRQANSLVQLWKNENITLTEMLNTMLYGDVVDQEESDAAKTAYHESGHAVCAVLLGLEVDFVSVRARASHGGMVRVARSPSFTRKECWGMVVEAMAGRCAEELFVGEDGVSATSATDMEHAVELVKTYLSLGFDDHMVISLDAPSAMQRAGELLDQAYQEAAKLVKRNSGLIEAFAQYLMENGDVWNPTEVIDRLQKTA